LQQFNVVWRADQGDELKRLTTNAADGQGPSLRLEDMCGVNDRGVTPAVHEGQFREIEHDGGAGAAAARIERLAPGTEVEFTAHPYKTIAGVHCEFRGHGVLFPKKGATEVRSHATEQPPWRSFSTVHPADVVGKQNGASPR
jgi:hypothetical protein